MQRRRMNHRNNVEMGLLGEGFDSSLMGRIRDNDGYESRSGSDNFDGVSGEDDQEAADDNTPNRSRSNKKYHRHTPHQIQELETFFKDCPHPDEKQRLELSRRLGLETKQVKFWFQNRRTQMKTQLERHENLMLRQENDKLRAENGMMKEGMANPICNNCGSQAIPGQISFEEHQLRIENARLKDELNRICALASKFIGRPISTMALPTSMNSAALDLAIGRNYNINNNNIPIPPGFGGPSFIPMGLDMGMMMPHQMANNNNNDQTIQAERSMLIDLALSSMEELMKMAQGDAPLWTKTLDGENEVLNLEEYGRIVPPCLGPKPDGYVTEATRHTGIVMINSLALIETLMDVNRWGEMFGSMIARAVPLDVIASGMGGTRSGTLLVLEAELQMMSPLVPVRQTRMLRLCKQQTENQWAVVDVSVDIGREPTNAHPFVRCRRLPSGCLIQDMPNGYSKVTWVEHWEYDENVVHQVYRPMVNAGIGFGSHRWISTLQRQCECLAILLSSSISTDDHTTLSQGGRRSMVKLAQRMTENFCSGIVASSCRRWERLHVDSLGDDVKIMTRNNNEGGEAGDPPGIMLSASTSFWLPVSRQRLFDFLRDDRRRLEWDILSSGAGTMQEVAVIAKGQTNGNCVSLLRSNVVNGNETGMVILQDTWTDATGSMVVYASVDLQSLNVVMSGGDSSYVALLPSGFAIHSDGPNASHDGSPNGGGSLLTVGLQILVNTLPTGKLTVESVETINNVMMTTVDKIKEAVTVG